MNKTYKLTQTGVQELNKELQKLIDRRPEITERIRSARELGDLSENAEYASARTEQERTEIRIKEIETILKNVEIIKATAGDGRVDLGDTVTLKNDKGERQYQVVGTVEADPLEGKISDESPIGIALLGKHIGDEVKITLPSEIVTYKITQIG
jgi:transcription elongation factor GreA